MGHYSRKTAERWRRPLPSRNSPQRPSTSSRHVRSPHRCQGLDSKDRGRYPVRAPQLYTEAKRHTFEEAVERYFKEQAVSVVKRGHLHWWERELGALFLHDVRPAVIVEKKQKLLSTPTPKGVIRSKSTCNRYLATLSHLLSICVKQWEWLSENPVRKISREKEPRERTRFLSPDERQRLLNACNDSDNPYLFTFVVLLLSTGGRYNEIRLSQMDRC